MTAATESVIRDGEVYDLPEFQRRSKLGRHAYRSAIRNGLKVIRTAGRVYVRGSDWLADAVNGRERQAEHIAERSQVGEAMLNEAREGDRVVEEQRAPRQDDLSLQQVDLLGEPKSGAGVIPVDCRPDPSD